MSLNPFFIRSQLVQHPLFFTLRNNGLQGGLTEIAVAKKLRT